MTRIFKGSISFRQLIIGALILSVVALFCAFQGYPLVIPVLIFFFSIHLLLVGKADRKLFLDLGLLLTLTIFMAHGVVNWGGWSAYYIPASVVGMLTMILFNSPNLMFLMSLLTSWVLVLVVGGDIGLLVIFFLGNLAGAYSVRDARRIATVINAGVVVAAVQIFCMTVLTGDMAFTAPTEFLQIYIKPFAINGFVAAAMTMILLKGFEWLFDVVTNFTLLELSDFNQPLLKRMILEAPGTYHHSLIVGNLAEGAADAIGADALLTRVGSYYHDIGKMDKSEYFTENQLAGSNKHDDLEPSVSRLVIINHVKNGIELGKKYKLNQKILNFIPEHHGTSLMYFFYQRALQEAEDPSTVDEAGYRYPGPNPQTKETAIVLLADSVEAATRSLDDPSPKKIEELVRKIINNKFIDGQLDECDLTLNEIDQIAVTFTKVLSAMYHTRVKYPEKKPNGD